MQRKQQGITLIGFICMAALVCGLGLIALKVIPVYINHFSIVRSMKDLQKLPKANLQQSPEAGSAYLKEYLSRKLYINEIRFISKRDMKVKRKRKGYLVSVPYVVEKKLISNIYLVFKFDPTYEVTIAGE